MEFRYRAVNVVRPSAAMDTPPSPSPNPNFSSFPAAPPISGCNLGPTDDHIQETIQREILKEQIRQVMIVADRMIHELIIENEMAIRRLAEMKMSLERLPSCINNRNLTDENNNLLQQCAFRDPRMRSGSYNVPTSPLMQLPRIHQMPESVGAKETSVMESDRDNLIVLDRPDSIGAKRKAEDTHTNLERAKRKAEAPYAVGMRLEQLSNEKQVETVERKSNSKYKFWCDICRVGAYSQIVMRDHISGKRHQAAALKQQKEPCEITSTSLPMPPLEDVREMVIETGNAEGDENKKRSTFWCEICKIRTYSLRLMEGHKLGKKHKAALEKQGKPVAVLDTKLTSVAAVPVIAQEHWLSGYKR